MNIPVSVVLPTHNRASTVARAIDSVLKQAPSLFAVTEVIVVDDGSVDETVAVVSRVVDPRIRLVRLEERRGACYARNCGVSAAANEFVAFQDSDDIWHEEKLSVLGGCYRPDIDAYFSAFVKLTDGRKELYPTWLKKKEYGKGALVRYSLARNPVSTATLLIKKNAVLEAGGFDEKLDRFQDWEFIIRVFGRHRVVFVNQPLVTVEVRADSISRRYLSGIESRLYIVKKHLKTYARHPVLFLRCMAGILLRVAFIPFKSTARL